MTNQISVVLNACPHCRSISGHAPTCPTQLESQLRALCATGRHRWAWLNAGGQACGICGAPR